MNHHLVLVLQAADPLAEGKPASADGAAERTSHAAAPEAPADENAAADDTAAHTDTTAEVPPADAVPSPDRADAGEASEAPSAHVAEGEAPAADNPAADASETMAVAAEGEEAPPAEGAVPAEEGRLSSKSAHEVGSCCKCTIIVSLLNHQQDSLFSNTAFTMSVCRTVFKRIGFGG